MRLFILCFFIVLSLVFFNSCKDSGVGPENKDLVWSADTVLYPGDFQTSLRSIWGSSHNNLYIAGHSNSSRGTLWRNNGSGWKTVDFFKDIEQSSISFAKIFGTANNNIWAVGDKFLNDYENPGNYLHQAFAMKFDGTKWIDQKFEDFAPLVDVWTDSPNNVWILGFKGLVYHYDGIKWNKEILKPEIPSTDEFSLRGFVKYKGQYIMSGVRFINNGAITTYYDFRYSNEAWTVVDSFTIDANNFQYKWGTFSFFSVDNRLFSYGIGGVYEYIDNNWNKIFDPPSAIYCMHGNNEKNIYVGGTYAAYHFNGTIWQQLSNFDKPDIYYTAAWTDGEQTIITGVTLNSDPQKTIVFRGQ